MCCDNLKPQAIPPEEVNRKIAGMANYKEMYKSPQH